ncbi:MAG: S49 family peptidase [Bacteroidota bacterium]
MKEKFMPKTAVLKENTLLRIKLEGCIVEHAMELPTTYKRISLTEMKGILEEAAYNNYIKGIYIDLRGVYGGMDKIESLRRIFAKFKQESGKPVIICSARYSDVTLAFASIADERIIRPAGTVYLTGFSFKSLYYRELFDFFDVEPLLYQSGEHKMNSHPYWSKKMDEYDKNEWMNIEKVLHRNCLNKIASMSGKSTDMLEEIINTTPLLTPEQALAQGLVTYIGYESDVDAIMSKYFKIPAVNQGKASDKKKSTETKFERIDYDQFKNYLVRKYKKIVHTKEGSAVAILPLQGGIEQKERGTHSINPKWSLPLLKEYGENKDVKAIIIILSSPGGDVLPTDEIAHEIKKITKTKPVICLVRGYAFSGGQYIAAACTKTIASSKLSLFGSIGVWSLFMNLKKALENHAHIHVDGIKTHKFSDIYADPYHPHSEEEKKIIQASTDYVYEIFIKHIKDSRGMTDEELKKVIGGMLFTAEEALRLKLIDEIIPEDVNDQLSYVINIALKEAGIDPDEVDEVRRIYPKTTFNLRRFLVYFVNGYPIYTMKKIKEMKEKHGKTMARAKIAPCDDEEALA